jgi:hypothetical protein
MTMFSGSTAVSVYQCVAIASALRLYAKTGMKVNRAYTPKAMMDTAAALTGKKFKARDYVGAADALKALADQTAAEIAAGKHEGNSITA